MVVPWLNYEGSNHGLFAMVQPRYCGRLTRFCRETSLLANLDKSSEVGEWLSKSGSRINESFVYLVTRPTIAPCRLVSETPQPPQPHLITGDGLEQKREH